MNDVPYIAYESAQARQERTIKRLWLLCIVMLAALIISNGAWIYYERSFENATEISQEVDTGNGDTTVIGIGDYNGTDKTDN